MNNQTPIDQEALIAQLLAEYRSLLVEWPELAEAAANDAEWLARISS